jgi:hypothetical protein
MHDGVNRMLSQCANQIVLIEQIALDEYRGRAHRLAVPIDQIVVNDGHVTGLDQLFGYHTTDIARSTGDENIHKGISFR